MRGLAFVTAFVLLTIVPCGAQAPEKTPKGSVKVVVTGCVQDRLLRASDVQAPEDDTVPVIHRTIFRLSGKKALRKQIEDLEGHRLAVTGFVRKLDLQEPGIRVRGGRVVLGAPSNDPRRPSLPDTGDRPVVLEAIEFEEVPGTCR